MALGFLDIYPIDILSIEGCMDLTVIGGPFEIDYTAKGINELAKTDKQPENLFEGSSHSLSFTPDSNFVRILRSITSNGTGTAGWYYLRFSLLSQRLFDTPPITIVERGQFPAIRPLFLTRVLLCPWRPILTHPQTTRDTCISPLRRPYGFRLIRRRHA